MHDVDMSEAPSSSDSGILNDGGFVQFQNWRAVAQGYEYHILINGKLIKTISYEQVDFFTQSFSLNVEDCLDRQVICSLPFKMDIYAVEDKTRAQKQQLQSQQDASVGSKRRAENEAPSPKRMKPSTPTQTKDPNRPSHQSIFSDTIYSIRETGFGSDRSGRIKILAKNHSSSHHGQPAVIICSIYCTLHGSVFLFDPLLSQSLKKPIDNRTPPNGPSVEELRKIMSGFRIFLTVRDMFSKETLMEKYCPCAQFGRVESPFRQTVSVQSFQEYFTIDHELIPPKREPKYDMLRLVGDIVVFDKNNRLFWSRSAILWIESALNGTCFSASMLFPPNESGNLIMQFKVANGKTELRSCLVSVTLSRISQWYCDEKRNVLKVLPVFKTLLDVSPKPQNPLDIFCN